MGRSAHCKFPGQGLNLNINWIYGLFRRETSLIQSSLINKALTHSHTFSLTHILAFTHSLTLTHSLTHSFAHSLIHQNPTKTITPAYLVLTHNYFITCFVIISQNFSTTPDTMFGFYIKILPFLCTAFVHLEDRNRSSDRQR